MLWQEMVQRGLLAAIPAAADVPVGTLYYATDTEELWQSDGAVWQRYSIDPAGIGGGGGGGGITELTGDVTAAGTGSVAATIANQAVSYAKMQNVSAASKLLGRGDGGAGSPQEITLGSGLTMAGTTLSASGGGGGTGAMVAQVFSAQENTPPVSAYAQPLFTNGHLALSFGPTSDEFAIFSRRLPDEYAGGGLTIDLVWFLETATAGSRDVRWTAAIERMEIGVYDADVDSFATEVAVLATGNAGSTGILNLTSIALTDGAEMDGLQAGEEYRLRISRDATHAADAYTFSASLLRVIVRETP